MGSGNIMIAYSVQDHIDSQWSHVLWDNSITLFAASWKSSKACKGSPLCAIYTVIQLVHSSLQGVQAWVI